MKSHIGCLLLLLGLLIHSNSLKAQTSAAATYNAAIAAASTAADPSQARGEAIAAYVNEISKTPEEKLANLIDKVREMISTDFTGAMMGICKTTLSDANTKKLYASFPEDLAKAILRYRVWYVKAYPSHNTNAPNYPAGLPRQGEPWTGSEISTTATANNASQQLAECDRIVKAATIYEFSFKPGDVIYQKDNPRQFYIYQFDCSSKSFMAISPADVIRNPDTRNWERKLKGPYMICPQCHGNATGTGHQIIKDDNWHQTGFNTYQRNTNGVKRVEVITNCSRCKGAGYVKQE